MAADRFARATLGGASELSVSQLRVVVSQGAQRIGLDRAAVIYAYGVHHCAGARYSIV